MDESENKELVSREYQVELFELAVKKNIILYLPTGSGKTFIATLLIKHFCNKDKDKIYLPIDKGGVRTFFLVNTVALVHQQASHIVSQTTLSVGRYSGDIGVDLWENEVWQYELNKNQIFVMTCQIFVDLIEKNRMSITNVNLLIFDECHRAVSNHPMRRAMLRFENIPPNQQPRVLGLTATLLNGNIKPSNVQDEIRQLENTFMAEIQTSLDEEMVKLYSTNPEERRVMYDDYACNHICHRFCDSVLSNLKSTVDVVQIEDNVDPPIWPKNSYQIGSSSKKTNKRLKCAIEDVDYNLKTLGIYGGSLAVLAHLVQVQQMLPNVQQENARVVFQIVTADYVLIRKYLEDQMEKPGVSDLEKLRMFSSDKVLKLLSILKKVKATDSVIVFVQRRFSAKILYYLVSKASKVDPKLAHIKCNFVVGYNVGDPFKDTRENYLQRKQNTKVMNLFNQGELNVLFASNVVEEGVDISKCNYVIMFDNAIDFRAYVQSKGRARDKDSKFIIMVSRSDQSFMDKYVSFQKTENSLKQILYGGKSRLRTAPTSEEIKKNLFTTTPGLETYMPSGQNGPVITALSAVPTINRYFASLKVDKFTKVNHFWFIVEEGTQFRCLLQLPMEAKRPALVKGTLQNTVENAKRSAALEACKILHAGGDLSDIDLLPVSIDVIVNKSNFTPSVDENEVFEEVVDGKIVKVGTKRNKRTCDKKWADTLTGCAPQPDQEVYLHLIEVTPKYNPPTDNNRLWMVHHFLSLPNHFAILSSKKLPKLAPFPLYLSVGELEARICLGEKIKLNSEELMQISDFHWTIFDSVLKLAKQFMIRDLSNTQNAYLIAPVVKDNNTIRIDWDVMRESKKTFPSPNNKPTIEDRQSLQVTDDNYFGRIVTPWYRTVPAQKYIVTKVCYNMSEETQFPTENYENYKEYFEEKYKIKPLVKGQPLLEVRALSSGLNSIKPRAATKQHRRKNKDENEEFEVFLLPEFCVVYPVPGAYWLKAQLLPSALHRVSQLCLAEELRCTISRNTGIGPYNQPSDWQKLKEDASIKKNKDSDQDKPQALKPLTLSNHQNGAISNVPDIWGAEEEPVDIERCMESASLVDILTYANFIKKSLTKTVAESGCTSLSETPGSKIDYDKKMKEPPPLAVLSKGSNTGPQQTEVLQALTAAVANDIVNCERLETLGDSFLKFATSVALFETQTDLQEGHLTTIKGAIVGNRNLFFCGKKKGLGPLLGVDEFSPKDDWVAPGFHVPHSVQGVIRRANLNVNCLYNVEIPDSERKSDVMTPATQDLFKHAMLDESEELLQAQNCSFTNQLALTDKNISDAVEALLGVYLKSSGITGALDLMNWFGVTDPNLLTREVLTMRSKSAGKGSGDPNTHLQQPHNLERILNYKFKDRNFLLQALTHPSYTRNNITKCYQCLEFLGDAVIDFLITVHIYEKCSTLTPGDLTDLRSALVNNVTLACISVRNHFHKFLLYHSSILNEYISRFVKNQEERNHVIDHDILFLVEEGDVNIAESVDVPKALGDVFEALIGAIYLDSGKDLNVTWRIVYNLMKEEIESFSKDIPKNHVRMLYESGYVPEFASQIEKSGVVMVAVEIHLNGTPIRFNGFGDNKREAKRAAAKHALRHIRFTLQH